MYCIVPSKQKCCHFDEIFITGSFSTYQNDNFQSGQCWKFHQNDDISVSVYKGSQLNIKMSSYQQRNSDYKHKMWSQPSYFYNGSPYAWKDGLYIAMEMDQKMLSILHNQDSPKNFTEKAPMISLCTTFTTTISTPLWHYFLLMKLHDHKL